jgi:hypothetical protein
MELRRRALEALQVSDPAEKAEAARELGALAAAGHAVLDTAARLTPAPAQPLPGRPAPPAPGAPNPRPPR